ncbi:unnamed protein product [Rotaria magnacalcarata]|uniref:Uncharacterized protein n=2 Tax=Rotaria magnacalcarata TaxID=392030 RepID=A0A816TRZ3_9BILA|nr:unnamed protein product [Rotaria magnacalcarata]
MTTTQFKVIGCLNQGNLHIIQLEETTPSFPLLQPVSIVGSLPIQSNPSGDSTASSFKISKKNQRHIQTNLKSIHMEQLPVLAKRQESIPSLAKCLM